MPPKKWVPTDYLDEFSPAPRDNPSDWLIRLPDGRIALDANDTNPNAAPQPLVDGEIIYMSWTEHHGTGNVCVAVDGVIVAIPPMPPSPPGGAMFVHSGEPESVSPDLETLTETWDHGDSDTVTYFAWSDSGVPYILVGPVLEQVEPATVARCRILSEIIAERAHQDARWGGPAHDDTHDDLAWSWIIRHHLSKQRRPTDAATDNYRQILVEIGALAVAAIESYDRRHATPDEATDQAALDAWTRSGWSDLAQAED
ncbi:hypothetical protein [Magnetospirillum fulvum]|uniref:Uncharacterized protein n=1 Tax=Magnetospirillum fulvum MGU-K5 TaxID=1316936 RepID=S9S4N3_MAGFU|nr:hypothetical protein [Magnetospirillum fulvum]EPY00922.1 hypothetical protein K678_13588 [Magnetospirillum fulvum MGU-K5]